MITTRMPIRLMFPILCFLGVMAGVVTPALAADISVKPILIDENTEARAIINKELVLTNESDQKVILYATVNEIAVDTTGEIKQIISPDDTDRTTSIASWVEIGRGRIELEPRQELTVPLTLRVHPQAVPGDYHVFIGFAATNKKPDAQAIALRGEAEGAIVKLSIAEKKNELLRISGFFIDRFIVNKESRIIDIEVENNGDKPTVPVGEVIFYNSLGEELTSVPVNAAGIEVPAGEKKTIQSEVPLEDKLGRYKANVRLSYGTGQQAAVFDTALFFMVPLPLMLGIIVGIFVFSIIVTYLIRRAFYDELHDDESSEVPLYVRNDREHQEKDHDINLQKPL